MPFPLTGRRRRLAPLLLLALALIAAACSDDDFAGAPEDRGERAAQAAGVVDRQQTVAEQAAEEQAVIEGSEDAQSDNPPAVEVEDESQFTDADAGAAAADAGEEEQPAPVILGDAARGEELFFANGCNVCHGDTGGGGIGPPIAKTQLSLSAVLKQYRNPRDLMPQFTADRVPDEDVEDIYAFLQSLE